MRKPRFHIAVSFHVAVTKLKQNIQNLQNAEK